MGTLGLHCDPPSFAWIATDGQTLPASGRCIFLLPSMRRTPGLEVSMSPDVGCSARHKIRESLPCWACSRMPNSDEIVWLSTLTCRWNTLTRQSPGISMLFRLWKERARYPTATQRFDSAGQPQISGWCQAGVRYALMTAHFPESRISRKNEFSLLRTGKAGSLDSGLL